MILSRDFGYLVVGSATQDLNDAANIYILECDTLEIKKTLSFHTHGVQALGFSGDGKFLVSVGN